MKVRAGEIHLGQTIKHHNKILKIVDKQEITPGRRAAILHLNTIDVHSGHKLDLRMSPDDDLEQYSIYNTPHILSYHDERNGQFVFLNQKTFEEVNVPENLIDENKSKFLTNEQVIDLGLDEDGNFVTIIWPIKVTAVVKYAPAAQRNASVDDRKRVELENGAFIITPGYVKEGDKLIINMETMEFVGRV